MTLEEIMRQASSQDLLLANFYLDPESVDIKGEEQIQALLQAAKNRMRVLKCFDHAQREALEAATEGVKGDFVYTFDDEDEHESLEEALEHLSSMCLAQWVEEGSGPDDTEVRVTVPAELISAFHPTQEEREKLGFIDAMHFLIDLYLRRLGAVCIEDLPFLLNVDDEEAADSLAMVYVCRCGPWALSNSPRFEERSYIVSPDLNEPELLIDILEREPAASLPRRKLTKDELNSLLDDDIAPAWQPFYQWLKKNAPDLDDDDLYDLIVEGELEHQNYMVQFGTEARMQEREFIGSLFELVGEKKANDALKKYMDGCNSVPLWVNKGYSPNELCALRSDSPYSSSKVGRNDPCPCGSGKKYKNCHGKN